MGDISAWDIVELRKGMLNEGMQEAYKKYKIGKNKEKIEITDSDIDRDGNLRLFHLMYFSRNCIRWMLQFAKCARWCYEKFNYLRGNIRSKIVGTIDTTMNFVVVIFTCYVLDEKRL